MLFGLTYLEILVRILMGSGIGFCIGLTGVGGGVLTLPALTLLLGMSPVTAVGTASFYSFLTKASATFHHVKLKTIEWKIARNFLIGAIPSNILVARWISVREPSDAFERHLMYFIVGVICFSLGIMVVNGIIKRSSPALKIGEHTAAHYLSEHPVWLTGLNMLLGVLVGGLIGATSIGGGVLIVPALTIFFGLSVKNTVGTSIFMAVVLTLITSIIYGGGNEVDFATVAAMTAGSLLSVRYGSRWAVRLPERGLKLIMMGLILVATILMVVGVAH